MNSCEHLAAIRAVTPTADGCEDCLKTGDAWVHLRLCKSCGHVGCCDNSVTRHASNHYQASRHPVIESFEQGEVWGFCYVDDMFFASLPDV